MTDPDTPPVGFMSPPVHSRFKKGSSGNPRGRPRKPKTINTALQQALDRKVRFGERSVPVSEALILKLRELALQGDRQALALQRRIIDQAGLGRTDVHDPEEVKKRVLRAIANMRQSQSE